jgi:type IV pilus assembly protein PilX
VTSTKQQKGFVLVTALIFLMVLSLLGIMAVRSSLFEERLSANDRDLTFARENAELALRDAERDILGRRFSGQFCSAAPCATLRPVSTRPGNITETGNWWISTGDAVNSILDLNLSAIIPLNQQGIYPARAAEDCAKPLWSGANWQDGVIPARTCAGSIGIPLPTVQYGQFTDAPFPALDVPRPRYIAEIITPVDARLAASSTKVFFRITAVGFGRTTGVAGRTSVTLQSVFSPI